MPYFRIELRLRGSSSNQNSIRFNIDTNFPTDEGYRLTVSEALVTVTGKTPKALFYGMQTLSQLISGEDTIYFPAVEIEDTPRFSYRGMHLDVGRYFFPVDFIKKYIDLIALHKMNTFHWHLTEDQGWRIEIKKYPKLTEIGSVRKKTIVGHLRSSNEYDDKPHGGFYTQEEIKEIVKYAADRFISVIPEIEMPGHSTAALAAYPELACKPGPYEVATSWGVKEDVFCPTDKTFSFLEDVLSEVIELFPSEYIHIGGDECPKKRWEESAFCQQLIKTEGLADEHELQSYFIRRIEKFINSKGRKLIGWDEILLGGLSPNATVMSWRGVKGGIEAARQGHQVIMTPTEFCYFDYYQGDPSTEPLAIGGHLPVEKVYQFDPVVSELTEEQSKFVLGGQGNVWTEYIKTAEHVEYMSVPRMTALSEVLWSPKEKRDYENFKERFKPFAKLLDGIGVNYARHILED